MRRVDGRLPAASVGDNEPATVDWWPGTRRSWLLSVLYLALVAADRSAMVHQQPRTTSFQPDL